MGKRIYFTVTNDLSYDQRMHRICGSLAKAGYDVILVGRRLPASTKLEKRSFRQIRLFCWFKKGKPFYAEYNIRLFFFLLFSRMDAVCAIDLDTILPCLYISKIKKVIRIYDAHELFTELKEVVTRPAIQRAWLKIEQKAVPQFKYGYTVGQGIAEEFNKRYGVEYGCIRNMSELRSFPDPLVREKFLLYQGAVNEARGFEWLIPAMKNIRTDLVICGTGNFMEQLKILIRENKVEDKIQLKGQLFPEQLWQVTCRGYIGITISENIGLNQYLSFPNKFFDYIQAGMPMVTMDFPEYKKINDQFDIALLIPEATPELIAGMVNKLLDDSVLYDRLHQNCLKARLELNWQKEEIKLLAFYSNIFN